MARTGTQKSDWSSCGRLPKPALLFVLISIVEHKSDLWITEELQRRYKIQRAVLSIKYYRFHPKWKPEIDKIRREYEEALQEEAFSSKRFVLSALREVAEIALENKDHKGLLAAIKQACCVSHMG